MSNAVLVAVYAITFDGELLKPPYMDYHCQSFTTGADNDPEELFAIFIRFLPFSFAFVASKTVFLNSHFHLLL